jgi:ribosomal protein L37AE/L43A
VPPINAIPTKLKPYLFHGVELEEHGEEALADCPFCGREGKFSVRVDTGLWRCVVCAEGNVKGGGNPLVFLRKLWEHSADQTDDAEELAADRGLLYATTLSVWGLRKSLLTDEWLVPGHTADGRMGQLYRYSQSPDGRMALLATPGLNHHVFGFSPELFSPRKSDVYVCEGVWDAMAMWEVMRHSKTSDGRLVLTSNDAISLAATANVIGVPSCNVFAEPWAAPLAGKRVCLAYDNDHPRLHPRTGDRVTPAAYDGMRRAARLLAASEQPPSEIHYLSWGKPGEDHCPALPPGYDVRDALSEPSRDASRRVALLGGLLDKFSPAPDDWVPGRAKDASKKGGTELELLDCSEWRVLVNAWRKAMRWTEGLDRALSVMLAAVVSTPVLGDQLWVKIIGPAACGKSTLCEAVSVNKRYVFAKSTIRGFHSGWKTDREGKEDYGLVPKLRGKTLVTKDGDTLLQSPNLPQILSEARDLYDSTARIHYRHGLSRDHEGVRMTWLLCGTSSLRQIDSSELGERFLDCVIMEKIDDEMEEEILQMVAYRADRNMGVEANGKAEGQHDPDLLTAMRLTGGYIDFLRADAARVLDAVVMPEAAGKMCIKLGKFVAHMRARPSKRQDESAEREFATRLVVQMVRLAKCLAVVLNRDSTDDEVMRRVRAVALDTARGRSFNIAVVLHAAGRSKGCSVSGVAVETNHTEDKERIMLRFLRSIGVVEHFRPETAKGISSQVKWRLTPRMHRLWEDVVGGK